jgi:hypothetical protein
VLSSTRAPVAQIARSVYAKGTDENDSRENAADGGFEKILGSHHGVHEHVGRRASHLGSQVVDRVDPLGCSRGIANGHKITLDDLRSRLRKPANRRYECVAGSVGPNQAP